MNPVNPEKFTLRTHEISFRVRYKETDGQGFVHHSNYLNYFEMGRIEMLRAGERDYRKLEAAGVNLVVTETKLNFFVPAVFDDLLTLTTTVEKARGVRIKHSYPLVRGDELLVEGYTIVASIDNNGKVTRLPDWLRMD